MVKLPTRADLECECEVCQAEARKGPLEFLLWKPQHTGWYRPQSRGYTVFAHVVGRFSREHALDVQRSCHRDVWAVKVTSRGIRSSRLLIRGYGEDLMVFDLAQEVIRLRDSLRLAEPWNIDSVLARLVEAAEHLLDDHNCDGHGHEEVRYAAEAAKVIRLRLGMSGAKTVDEL